MAKRSKFVKPEQREIVSAHVLGSKQISPNFVRVTIGGEELRGFVRWASTTGSGCSSPTGR